MNRRPTIILDFDGVLNSYSSGWKGVDVIPDLPVGGAMEFLQEVSVHFDIAVFSSRSTSRAGRFAMAAWLKKHFNAHFEDEWPEEASRVWNCISFPTSKPPAVVSIDDRCVAFRGRWPTMDTLVNYKSWTQYKEPRA